MSLTWSTLALQTVNVAVLVWLLSRFLWRPLADAVARRRAETAATLAEAESRREEAEALKQELAAERAGIEAERRAAMEAAARDAAAERARLLAAAAEDAKRRDAAARARIEADSVAAEAAFGARAADLAAEMAARLGREVDGPALRAACLDQIVRRIEAMPERDRDALSGDGEIAVVSAAPLDQAEQAEARRRLTATLGDDIPIAFRADPALVAGIEIAGPHLTVSQSWRDGLARMRREIARDG